MQVGLVAIPYHSLHKSEGIVGVRGKWAAQGEKYELSTGL